MRHSTCTQGWWRGKVKLIAMPPASPAVSPTAGPTKAPAAATAAPAAPTRERPGRVSKDAPRVEERPKTGHRKPEHRKLRIADELIDAIVELEGEMFKDGYYKAFALLSGPCGLCAECAKSKNKPCNFGNRARPSMESCGIDVYQTAWNNGFPIQPLRHKGETQNLYCLLLVD